MKIAIRFKTFWCIWQNVKFTEHFPWNFANFRGVYSRSPRADKYFALLLYNIMNESVFKIHHACFGWSVAILTCVHKVLHLRIIVSQSSTLKPSHYSEFFPAVRRILPVFSKVVNVCIMKWSYQNIYKYCCNLRNSLTGIREQVGRQQRRKLHSRLAMTIFTKFLRSLKLYYSINTAVCVRQAQQLLVF